MFLSTPLAAVSLCVFAEFCGRYVLGRILSGDGTEDVVESIHDYLTTVSNNVRTGQVQVDDFIIFKVLHTASPVSFFTDIPY